jgi:hypothetical protein
MKLYWFFICTFIVTAWSCKSPQSKYTDAQIHAVESLIESKNYTIKSDWAYPQVTYAMQQVLNSGLMPRGSSANAISLIGNPNYLTVKKDSVKSYLPYFGERQMGAAYGDAGAIELEGAIENYEVLKGKKNSYLVKFNANSKTERFDIIIQFFPNYKSDIRIQSSSRFPISYSGQVEVSNP